jgi:CRISPR/Cas system CSM-associated protein Csm5 (group 7 of RAMP superfamily)
MNIGIKWDDWLSDEERADLKTMAETVGKQNQAAQDARNDVFKALGFWADRQTLNAIQDGRITRLQAIRMYHSLERKIIDVCMDTIPAPES